MQQTWLSSNRACGKWLVFIQYMLLWHLKIQSRVVTLKCLSYGTFEMLKDAFKSKKKKKKKCLISGLALDGYHQQAFMFASLFSLFKLVITLYVCCHLCLEFVTVLKLVQMSFHLKTFSFLKIAFIFFIFHYFDIHSVLFSSYVAHLKWNYKECDLSWKMPIVKMFPFISVIHCYLFLC